MAYSDPEEEFDEFLLKMKSLFDQDADREDFKELITAALDGTVSAGEINDLVESVAYDDLRVSIYEEALSDARDELRSEFDLKEEAIRDEYRNMESELKEEYDVKYDKMVKHHEDEVKFMAMCEAVDKRLLSEPDFLDYVLGKMKEDILESKENERYPYLYEETLNKVGRQEIMNFLLLNFKDDLLEMCKTEILADFRSVGNTSGSSSNGYASIFGSLFSSVDRNVSEYFIRELKEDLLKDKGFYDSVRREAFKDIAKKIFD